MPRAPAVNANASVKLRGGEVVNIGIIQHSGLLALRGGTEYDDNLGLKMLKLLYLQEERPINKAPLDIFIIVYNIYLRVRGCQCAVLPSANLYAIQEPLNKSLVAPVPSGHGSVSRFWHFAFLLCPAGDLRRKTRRGRMVGEIHQATRREGISNFGRSRRQEPRMWR